MHCSAFYPITLVSWPRYSSSMFASVIQDIMWMLLSVFISCCDALHPLHIGWTWRSSLVEAAVLFALFFLPLWTGWCPSGVTSCLSGGVTLCVRELLNLRHESRRQVRLSTDAWASLMALLFFVSRPGGGLQRASYSGHKRKHALKFHNVLTPDGLFFHLFGPVEGRRHDMTLYHESAMDATLAKALIVGGEQYYLYGDVAYMMRPWLQTVFEGILSPDQDAHSNAMKVP